MAWHVREEVVVCEEVVSASLEASLLELGVFEPFLLLAPVESF
jgi:hypothetical protein